MKSVIITGALLILFFAVLAQNTLDVVTEGRRETFDSIVQQSIQRARFDGCFTDDNIKELKDNLTSKIPGLEESDIIVNVTRAHKYRTEVFSESQKIFYDIYIPIEKIIAFGEYFGINNNSYNYGVNGYTLSEVPMP